MSAITFEHVTLDIGGQTVLSDVNFDIRTGEFVGVLGPNGAGKTTLMRAIVGLLAPRAGRISVFGEEPERGNPAIGYLPQTVVFALLGKGIRVDGAWQLALAVALFVVSAALGFVLALNAAGAVNFAHGDMVMLGGVAAVTVAAMLGASGVRTPGIALFGPSRSSGLMSSSSRWAVSG